MLKVILWEKVFGFGFDFLIFIYMFWRGFIASWQPVEVHSLIQLMLNHEYQSKNSLLTAPACKGRRSHSETEVHTCSEGVCVTAFAWVETNNLHSHYTCFYVQEFFKRYMAVGKTFFSCFFFPFPVLWNGHTQANITHLQASVQLCIPAHPVPLDTTHHCFGCGQLYTRLWSYTVALLFL